MLDSSWSPLLPPRDHVELMMLGQQWEDDEITENSRLASMVTLTEEHNGLSVYVPDGLPDDCP